MNKQIKRQLGIAAVVVGLAAPLTANAEHRKPRRSTYLSHHLHRDQAACRTSQFINIPI